MLRWRLAETKPGAWRTETSVASVRSSTRRRWLAGSTVNTLMKVITLLVAEICVMSSAPGRRGCAAEMVRAFLLSHRLRRRSSGVAPGEQAAAEEGAFQRAIPVHAAAAEAGGFADRVKPGDDLAVTGEYAGGEVGLETAQRLAGQDVELHRDQWTMGGIEDPVRLGGADQAVADISARVVDVHHL